MRPGGGFLLVVFTNRIYKRENRRNIRKEKLNNGKETNIKY